MDWSEKNLCIKCDGDGSLLVCSETGCPLAVHEECIGCTAKFDDAGKFYCPYCLYKRAVAESRQAREDVMSKKKALFVFLDEEMMDYEKHLKVSKRAGAKRRNQSEVSKANGKSRHNDEPSRLEKEHEICYDKGEKIQEVESVTSSGSIGEGPSLNMHEEQKISSEEEEKAQEEVPETSGDSSGQDPSFRMHGQKIHNAEEEKIQDEACETSSASTEDNLTLTKRARQSAKSKQKSPIVNPPGRSSSLSPSGLATDKMLDQRFDASRRSKQPKLPPVKLFGKRKRVLWSVEEEDMLKVGVQKFSAEANKNVPWRKILEFGSHIFDSSRTPVDLKDKWRNMGK